MTIRFKRTKTQKVAKRVQIRSVKPTASPKHAPAKRAKTTSARKARARAKAPDKLKSEVGAAPPRKHSPGAFPFFPIRGTAPASKRVPRVSATDLQRKRRKKSKPVVRVTQQTLRDIAALECVRRCFQK